MEIKDVYILHKRFWRYLLFGVLFILALSAASYSQQRTVTGTVTSSDDKLPLPGVNILVQGTKTGTITDLEGKYTIEIPDGDVTLQFSFVGFNTELITVGTSAVINISMTLNLLALDEVVITSLGIAREKKKSPMLPKMLKRIILPRPGN